MIGFAAGTLVHTDTGLVPVEQLKVNDKVLSKSATGNGECVYKFIVNKVVRNDVLVSLLDLTLKVDSSLPMNERIKLRAQYDSQPNTRLLITSNHPVWLKDKGWVKAEELKSGDCLVDKDSNIYTPEVGNNPNNTSSLRRVYKTVDANIGFVPYADYDSPNPKGRMIDLRTGTEIEANVSYKPVIEKLYKNDPEWKNRLLAQTPEDLREGAEFFGFRQGEWLDPDTVDWKIGEGLVRTTVYNIEVADTHSYFVGEAGIWVGGLT